MRRLLATALLLVLAGCGADGAPQPPAEPGLSVTGTVRLGATARL